MSATSLRPVSYVRDGMTPSRDGTRIHYYTIGDGAPTLVCCDGLGCDGYVWKYVVEDFAPRHRIVRWHYRAHGTSDAPADRSRMTIADLVDDLIAVLDANGVDRAILLGHSLGVQVILEAHRQHPERITGLVPMCGSYGRAHDTFHDGQSMHVIFPVVSGFVNRFPDAARKLWRYLDSEAAYQIGLRGELNPALVKRQDFRRYFTHLSQMDPQLFAALLGDAGRHDALPHLEHIDVPTLIIAGERDKFTPAWLSQVMHTRVRGSELCTVPLGSHTAPIEMPELVNLRLERFLNAHFSYSASTSASQRAG